MKKIKNIELAWLAGIIDGEGCIGLYYNRKNNAAYRPIITIVNTNNKLIIRICSLLNKLNIKYYFGTRKQNIQKNWKKSYCITIQYKKGVNKLLESIIPYIHAKKKQIYIVNKFCKTKYHKYGYSKIEKKNFEKMKELNKRGVK